jgi:hypothetical protein
VIGYNVPATSRSRVRRDRVASACWAGLIAVAFGSGALLRRAGGLPVDPFAPLHAHARLLVGPLLPAAAFGLAGVAVLPAAARRLRWRPLLAVGWLGSMIWTVTLAAPDGLARPLTARTEYLAGLPAIGDHPLRWLRGFSSAMQAYPTHVKGHPPLPTLTLWAIQWAGLRGPGWAAALVIGAGTSATVAVALTVRALAGEGTARRAIPFLVLAPTALWVATSVDAFFLGVGAWAVTLVTLAAAGTRTRPAAAGAHGPAADAEPGSPAEASTTGRSARTRSSGPPFMRPLGAAYAGGLLLGCLPYLSYGLLSFFALPLAVLVLTRPPRPVLAAVAAGCLVVPLGFTFAGFSWWDGVLGTHAAWAAGLGSRGRPYAYFLLGDLAVLALLAGPATARALPYALAPAVARIRALAAARGTAPPWLRPASGSSGGGHRLASPRTGGLPRTPGAERLAWPVMAALAGMVALDLSGVTRGEVERIWIPYAVWVIAANAVHRRPARALLLAQAVTALVIEALVRSPW